MYSKTYFIKGNLSCGSCNVIYFTTCSNCREHYVGSAFNYNQRFRIHKYEVKTNKDLCGTARHFDLLSKCLAVPQRSLLCCGPNNKLDYLKIHIIEQVFNNNQFSIEDLLWEREKYWQVQLFTNFYGMNNINIDIV